MARMWSSPIHHHDQRTQRRNKLFQTQTNWLLLSGHLQQPGSVQYYSNNAVLLQGKLEIYTLIIKINIIIIYYYYYNNYHHNNIHHGKQD